MCPHIVNPAMLPSADQERRCDDRWSMLVCCRVQARKGVVVTAGAWSGDLLADNLADDRWRSVFQPRRGHLLEVQAPPSMPPLRHGLMELGYTQVLLMSPV